MTEAEKRRASVLVAEPDLGERHCLKTALGALGFGTVCDAATHLQALDRLAERAVTHVIFDARKTNMPPKDFLGKVLEMDPKIIALPASGQPDVDDVFDLLILGARGYLVKPFTAETLDQALVMATKGDPLADAVREAEDRNQALSAIMVSSLDRLATLARQARQFETARRDVPKAAAVFERSADLARTFARGGPDALLESLQELCIERGNGPASRLGRLRRQLREKR
jgi:two-component system chemotaxis response regulator CheY